MDTLLVLFAALLVVAALFAVVRAIRNWRGLHRLLAGMVLAGALGWALWIVVSLRLDPTSHNLWPFEVVMIAGSALIALATISVVRPKRAP
jgi:hypothetical protein